MCCHPSALFISSLLFHTCVWLTLTACLGSKSLCQRPPLKTAQAWEIFFSSHLNFRTSIYPPFNLAYNDAIRTKSIWKFCWERLMFHGVLLLMPLCLHSQQMLWKQQIHSLSQHHYNHAHFQDICCCLFRTIMPAMGLWNTKDIQQTAGEFLFFMPFISEQGGRKNCLLLHR